ncbi:hypothetical protein MLD38_022128 [Melastoma candidum]|nr:hypothetical protein MLD38_022128 [Melastoma candidum]
MRLHPDREWRGVQPPTKEVKKERVIDYPQAVISGWLITGKRGRSAESVGSGLNSASMTTDGLSMPEPTEGKHVVYPTLMSNKEPTSARLNLPNDDNFLPRGDKETGSCSRTKVEIEIPPEQKPKDEPRVKAKKVSGMTSCTGLEDQKPKRAKKRKATEIDRTKPSHHAKRAAGERSGGASAMNYKCITCQKSFPTFWALGGHRSSCNKTRQSSTAQPKEANRAGNSSRDPQAAKANKPGTCSQNPRLDLSLSLPLFLSPDTTPSSSMIEDDNTCCNPTTGFQGDMNIPASEEDADDNERKMIKFL